MMLLKNNQTSFSISEKDWQSLLTLAQMYGWQSLGTMTPNNWNGKYLPWEPGMSEDWDSRYFGAYNQLVLKEDTCHLAKALETAIADLPPSENLETKENKQKMTWNQISVASTSPLQHFSGSRKKILSDFIEFSKLSDFSIS